MAGRMPKRTTSPGSGPAQKKSTKAVGYGLKGHKFTNQTKYNQSKSGQLHAKNPGLSKKPVGYGENGNAFFSAANYEHSKAGHKSGGHIPGGGHNPMPHTPMPGHPSQNASHYHGPSTTGAIKGARPRI